MKHLSLISLAAIAASCAVNAQDIKPTKVDLQTTQSRKDLLKQIGAVHEGPQDNGDFVYCTSDEDRRKSFSVRQGQVKLSELLYHTRRSARLEAGLDACDRALNGPPNPDVPFNSVNCRDALL